MGTRPPFLTPAPFATSRTELTRHAPKYRFLYITYSGENTFGGFESI